MSIKSINAKTAKAWLSKKEAVIIDVREPEEFNAVRISGAHLLPLGVINSKQLPDSQNKKIIVHCKMGKRGELACEKLLIDNPDLDIYNMEGGIVAWENAGFKVKKAKHDVISIERQVQIIIGSSVLLGLLLGYFIHAGFFFLAAFFAAGLLFSGMTGSCVLNSMIGKMPWNRKKTPYRH